MNFRILIKTVVLKNKEYTTKTTSKQIIYLI